MNTLREIEREIDNTVELTSICRGEWCRSLESKLDELEMELHDRVRRTCHSDRHLDYSMVEGKVRQGYRNLSPDIHM